MTQHNQQSLELITLRHRLNQVGNQHDFYKQDCTVFAYLLQADLREQVGSGCLVNLRRIRLKFSGPRLRNISSYILGQGD